MSKRDEKQIELQFTLSEAEKLAELHFGLRCAAKKLPGELAENFFLRSESGEEYTLKIAHPEESLAHLDMQNALMKHLERKNTGLLFPRICLNSDNEDFTTIQDSAGRSRYMRLLTWVPGRVWASVNPINSQLLFSLGEASARTSLALQDFDHAGAHIWHKWDLSKAEWIEKHLHLFKKEERRELVTYFFRRFQEMVKPVIPSLRKGVVYNDANDHNILVSESKTDPVVRGFIDFGDAIFTCLVNDLAIAITYAVMDKNQPLEAACHVVRGFHSLFPLEEKEVGLLYTLIATRLLLTVTVGAINAEENPNNEYLLISQYQAWNLLEKWRSVSPQFAHFSFRQSCGREPVPIRSSYESWLAENAEALHPVIDLSGKKVHHIDLSVGSTELGNNSGFATIQTFDRTISRILEDANADVGIGGYAECRPFYSTDAYTVLGNNGPQWRTLHLGTDIWIEDGIPVFSPFNGQVHSFHDNIGERNYGPTIILEHKVSDDLSFYTLYGHLSRQSLTHLEVGKYLAKGEQFATVGKAPENGNWPPHLHFQVILDMLDFTGDYLGVAFPDESKVWMSLCPDGKTFFNTEITGETGRGSPINNILATRKKVAGRSLSISYKKPLYMVRGYMQYLYTNDGRRYLDTVNNVAHVGHEHPGVVGAAQRQIAVLNTNTRYLHQDLGKFAEELLSTFPTELQVVHFVNSGSEANELAIRMAKTMTGGSDWIVVEHGYHGNTNACIDLSSYKFDGKAGSGAPVGTHVLPIPDTFRGQFKSPDSAGKLYAAFAEKAIEIIFQNNRVLAGFICESILSCGGQIVLPKGYLKDIYSFVRKAGGVCIADEVQVGLGRVGNGFWGFELQEVIPDIVTIGKPLGNGHPVAAVVTTAKIADAFANGMEYFNTYGGNPVSCAIGRKVLEIVQSQSLQKHAMEVGSYLKLNLNELIKRHQIIGDVRGHGLFLGIELVKPGFRIEPATQQANHLINRMREKGILMSTDGPFENVLKIKPPLCFTKTDADRLCEELDITLKEDHFQ